MLQKIRTLSFIPEKRPRLHYDPDTTSLTPCFLVVRRRFERAAPIGDLAGDARWGKNDGGPVRAAGRASRPTLAMPATSATAGSPPVGRPASAPARPSGWPSRRIATTTGERPRPPAFRRGARRIPATAGARARRRCAPRQRSPSRLSGPRQRLGRPCRTLVTPRHRPSRGRYRRARGHRYKMSRGRRYKRSWLLNPMF